MEVLAGARSDERELDRGRGVAARASLLAQDVDLQRLGQIVGIKLDEASPAT